MIFHWEDQQVEIPVLKKICGLSRGQKRPHSVTLTLEELQELVKHEDYLKHALIPTLRFSEGQ